jgi:hypothetical protein
VFDDIDGRWRTTADVGAEIVSSHAFANALVARLIAPTDVVVDEASHEPSHQRAARCTMSISTRPPHSIAHAERAGHTVNRIDTAALSR